MKHAWLSLVSVWLTRVLVVLAIAFFLVPIVIVGVMSFSSSDVLMFPPKSFGFRQYSSAFSSGDWWLAARTSLVVGAATAVVSCVIAILGVLAIARTRVKAANWVYGAALLAIVAPVAAVAVALYQVLAKVGLLGSMPGLVIAHCILGVPVSLLVLRAGLSGIPQTLELAAMSLGASRVQAWIHITIRLLASSFGAAFILTFLMSFDEAVFATFLGGAHVNTLPRAIFNSIRFGLDPVITAIATILMVATGVLAVVGSVLRRGRR